MPNEPESRKSQSCVPQDKSTSMGIGLIGLMLGVLFILIALSLILTGGSYAFAWDFAKWVTWEFLIFMILGVLATLIGIMALMRKKCA